ncbi:hypothetical protein AB0392_49525 [Nonomuraea angiospora]
MEYVVRVPAPPPEPGRDQWEGVSTLQKVTAGIDACIRYLTNDAEHLP